MPLDHYYCVKIYLHYQHHYGTLFYQLTGVPSSAILFLFLVEVTMG